MVRLDTITITMENNTVGTAPNKKVNKFDSVQCQMREDWRDQLVTSKPIYKVNVLRIMELLSILFKYIITVPMGIRFFKASRRR